MSNGNAPGYGNVAVEYMKGTGPFYGTGSRVAGTAPPATIPTYNLNGSPSTTHAVEGTVTAVGTSLSIAFPKGLAFKTTAYSLLVTDTTSGNTVTSYSSRTPAGFSFATNPGNVYTFYAVGT